MTTFNYAAMAELYPTRSWKRRAGPSDSRLPRKPCASLWRSFLLSSFRELILRSEGNRSTAVKFDLLYEDRKYPFPRKLPLSRPLEWYQPLSAPAKGGEKRREASCAKEG
jgi:hypothetical protein